MLGDSFITFLEWVCTNDYTSSPFKSQTVTKLKKLYFTYNAE